MLSRRCLMPVLLCLCGLAGGGDAGAETETATARTAAGPAEASAASVPAVFIDSASSSVTIDGELAEPVWQQAAVITGMTRIQPVEGGPGFGHAEWRVFYGKGALYVGVRVRQPEGILRAHITPRDDLTNDDSVNIYINPTPEVDGGYVFRVNPMGVQRDMLSLHGRHNASWDGHWQSAGVPLADGYSVEVRIPFDTLRFPRAEVQSWGLGLAVFTASRGQIDFWPAISADRGSQFTQLGVLGGLENIRPGSGLEILTSLAARHGGGAAGGEPFQWDQPRIARLRGQGLFDPGLDVRYGLTTGLTAAMALNPDFSQIEADADQLDYNLRFPLFLPEKRPLFLEGSDNFETPVPLLYTRGINDPIAGLKLTGKEQDYLVGALVSWDQDPPPSRVRIDPTAPHRRTGFDDMTGKTAVTSVARVAADVAGGSRIGAFAATKQALAEDGTLAGDHQLLAVDTRLRLADIYFITAQAGISRTTGERIGEADPLLGSFYLVNVRREDRRLALEAESAFYSTDFRAETSALTRVGYLQSRAAARYKIEVNRASLPFVLPELGLTTAHGTGNADIFDWSIAPAVAVQLGGSSQLRLDYAHGSEHFNGRDFPQRLASALLVSSPTTWLSGNLALSGGRRINYDPLDAFQGTVLEGNMGITVRPTAHAQLDVSYIKSLFWRDVGQQVAEDVDLARVKLRYNVDTRWSLRLISQLNTYHHSLHSSLLLAYEHSPGTAFYAGYQGVERTSADAVLPLDRRAFIKFSYRWVL